MIDLCQGLFQCLPKLISLIAGNRWILGEVLAVVVFSTKGSFIQCNLFLVCTVAVNKIVRCLNPLGTLHVSKLQISLVTMAAVTVFLINWLWYFYFTLTGYYVMFYSELACDLYGTTSQNNKYSGIELILVGVFLLLPTIILSIASVMLVYVAVSMAKTAVNKKNIVVTILIALFFLLHVVPFCVWFAIYESQTGYDGMLKTSFSFYSTRIIFQLETVNVFINPAVYFITMKQFRRFFIRYVKKRRSESVKGFSNSHSLEREASIENRTGYLSHPSSAVAKGIKGSETKTTNF